MKNLNAVNLYNQPHQIRKVYLKFCKNINFLLSCQCGLLKREHKIFPENSEHRIWERDTCTKPGGITDAFGGIRFIDKNDEISKYIRVYYKTEMEKMITLLFEKSYWNMNSPRLLISVTGGAQVAVSELVRDTLCKGLVKAASSTSIVFFF